MSNDGARIFLSDSGIGNLHCMRDYLNALVLKWPSIRVEATDVGGYNWTVLYSVDLEEYEAVIVANQKPSP